MKSENFFGVLIGEQLSSVVFVQDYLQLDFDGNTITCYEWPTIVQGASRCAFGQSEYRNMLCCLISRIVVSTIFEEEKYLKIEFSETDKIEFNLSDATGEVIYFTFGKNEWISI